MRRTSEMSTVPTGGRTGGRTDRMPSLYGTRSLATFFDEMERMMEDTFGRSFRRFGLMGPDEILTGTTGAIMPPLDLFEEGGHLVVRTEIPGIRREDVDVSISGNVLVISGEKKSEGETERKGYLMRETSCGTFRRSLRLPEGIDTAKAEASFHDGVLVIRMPKTEESRVHHVTVH